jgi:hypothetical protein
LSLPRWSSVVKFKVLSKVRFLLAEENSDETKKEQVKDRERKREKESKRKSILYYSPPPLQ